MSAFININPQFKAQVGTFEAITVSNTPIGITSTLLTVNEAGGAHKRAVAALISVETQSIRFTIDGTTVSDTAGHLLAAGDYILVEGEGAVAALKMHRATGSDGAAKVTVFYNR